MDELKLVVRQELGSIKMNFDELKTALESEMMKYEAIVYDDSAITDAKADAAELRKLKKSVEDRRKEIKNKCLEPYESIEPQVKELVALIDKPINLISKQVSDYESKQKAKKKEEILAYMSEAFSGLPSGIAGKLKFKIYDTKWENATATKKSWKEAIDNAVAATMKDLKLLEDVDPDFKEDTMKVYSQNLELGDALTKANEMAKQKEKIMERERQRQEEERRRNEQERIAKEQKELEAAEHATESSEKDPFATTSVSTDTRHEASEEATLPFEMEKTFIVTVEVGENNLGLLEDFLKNSGMKYEVR